MPDGELGWGQLECGFHLRPIVEQGNHASPEGDRVEQPLGLVEVTLEHLRAAQGDVVRRDRVHIDTGHLRRQRVGGQASDGDEQGAQGEQDQSSDPHVSLLSTVPRRPP